MITYPIETVDANTLTLNHQECLRYLHIAKEDADLSKTMDACLPSLCAIVTPTYQYAELSKEEFLKVLPLQESTTFQKAVKDAGTIALFCATLGASTDLFLKKQMVASPAQGVVMDAMASTLIENVCDKLTEIHRKQRSVYPRVSPGYGDLPLSLQPLILNFLGAQSMHVHVSDSFMLIPGKTVTAFFGIL